MGSHSLEPGKKEEMEQSSTGESPGRQQAKPICKKMLKSLPAS